MTLTPAGGAGDVARPSGGSSGGPPAPEPAAAADRGVRASDAEREAVVHHLNIATGEGRLTLAEYSDRVERAYASVTRADLEPLLADLPVSAAPRGSRQPVVAGVGVAPVSSHRTPIGSIKRSGRWRLDGDLELRVTVGSIKIDLRGAEIAQPSIDLHLVTGVGSVKVWVPDRVRVVVGGHSSIGSRQIEQDSVTGDGPLLRLTVDTGVGSVKVYRS